MLMKKPVGRGGATRKYDLLTVLGVHALSRDKHLQRQALRLICLITARYNWQNDNLSVGQAEIARLWSVDPRTVKREMAAFRKRGWLVEKRAAARGRVTVYGLGIETILAETRPGWDKVGPDLVARLLPAPAPETPDRKVIPFPQGALPEAGTLWGRVARRLQQDDAALYLAWFAPLEAEERAGELWVRAPSGFHATYLRTHLRPRLEAALQAEDPTMGLHLR